MQPTTDDIKQDKPDSTKSADNILTDFSLPTTETKPQEDSKKTN
jgi:hypothetical protein